MRSFNKATKFPNAESIPCRLVAMGTKLLMFIVSPWIQNLSFSFEGLIEHRICGFIVNTGKSPKPTRKFTTKKVNIQ